MRKLSAEDLNLLAEECFFTLDDRKLSCEKWRGYYYQGAPDGMAEINRVYGEINNYLSLVFSPEHIILEGIPMNRDVEEEDPEQVILDQIQETVRDNFFGNRLDIRLSDILKMCLVDGGRVIKEHWSASTRSVKYFDIPYDLFGVMYEALELQDQAQIFCEKTDLTERQVEAYYPDIYKIIKARGGEDEGKLEQSAGLKILLGGQGSTDAVIENKPGFDFRPRSARNTYEQKTLWQWEKEEGEWRRSVLVEGELAKDHLTGMKEHNYFNLKPLTIPGYFYGLSAVYLLHRIQDHRNKFLPKLDKAIEKLLDPPIVITGYAMGGETANDVVQKLKIPGNAVVIDGQGVKAEPFTPKLEIDKGFQVADFYDLQQKFILGVNEVLMGQAQKNVRSQGYASMLAQFASSEPKRVAHNIEAQLEEIFTYTGRLFQANDATDYKRIVNQETKQSRVFKLGQYSRDYRIEIYGHTGSPITTEMNVNLSLTLLKAGIMKAEILVKILPIPYKSKVLAWLKKKEEAMAKKEAEELSLRKQEIEQGRKPGQGAPKTGPASSGGGIIGKVFGNS